MPLNAMRKSEEETRSFLENLAIFSSFNVDELSTLARHMSYIHLQRGEYLFVEGDPGTFLGFVVNGILEIQKRRESGEYVTLARLTKGASIGEMALIDKSPRSATVIAPAGGDPGDPDRSGLRSSCR
jgi:CRP/FNR family transcriptional regulator, cyclic AMP receptor protein